MSLSCNSPQINSITNVLLLSNPECEYHQPYGQTWSHELQIIFMTSDLCKLKSLINHQYLKNFNYLQIGTFGLTYYSCTLGPIWAIINYGWRRRGFLFETIPLPNCPTNTSVSYELYMWNINKFPSWWLYKMYIHKCTHWANAWP